MASRKSDSNDAEPMTFTNYKPTLYKRFAEMFLSKQLTDAILICENQRVHVHKFLLSASSSFFNRMFKKPQMNILHIRNVKYVDLSMVLEYIYKGEVALSSKERVAAFIGAAWNLSIPLNEKDMEAVTLKWGLTFQHQNNEPDTRKFIDTLSNETIWSNIVYCLSFHSTTQMMMMLLMLMLMLAMMTKAVMKRKDRRPPNDQIAAKRFVL